MEPNQYNKLYKLLILGQQKCGKTALLAKFVQDKFDFHSYIPTIGIDFRVRTIEVNNIIMKLQVWDTAGQQRFQTISHAYYGGCNILIFVFDLSRRQSFQFIKNKIINSYEKNMYNGSATAILLGTKLDLDHQRKVQSNQANELGQLIGQYMQVSSVTGFNVQNAFLSAVLYKFNLDQQNIASGYRTFKQLMQSNISYIKQNKKFENPNKQPTTIKLIKQQKIQIQNAAPGAPSMNSSIIFTQQNQSKIQNQIQSPQYQLIRCLLIGLDNVGKSSICKMYSDNKFTQTYTPTIGVQFFIKCINNHNNKNYKFQIWDTTGQQRFKTITRSYFKGVNIYFVVYDITNRKSFQRAIDQFNQIKIHANKIFQYVCLVGNKIDLQQNRQVFTQEGIKQAQNHQADFIQISTKNYEDVVNLFARGLKHIQEKS